MNHPIATPDDNDNWIDPTQTSWWQHLQELYKYRFLLQNLVRRDLKVRYRNSVLGVLWSLLNPLLLMSVFTLIFTVFNGQEIRQYSVFFLVGLISWNFFSGSLLAGTQSIAANANLIKKVYFPREILPASTILSQFVNYLIALGVLIVFIYTTGLGLTRHALWVPVILVTQLIFTFGLTLLLGSLHVFYRDVIMILDVVLLAGFFLTPIFYPLSLYTNPLTIAGISLEPARVMRWINPMASIVDGYRTVLWGIDNDIGPSAMAPDFIFRTTLTAVLVFIIGYTVFRRTQHLFSEKL
jgi:ABC-type polysaccharide/polyol phosphate export permease